MTFQASRALRRGPDWLDARMTHGEAVQLCDEIERRCGVTIRKRPVLSTTARDLLELLAGQGVIGGDVSRVVERRSLEVSRDPRGWPERIAAGEAGASTCRADGAAQERR